MAEYVSESKNYEQAYQYYSRLLEEDPSDEQAWAGKGLTAGWLSTPENQKLDELVVSVRQAFKNGLGAGEKDRIAAETLAAAESYINKAKAAFDEGVREFDKKAKSPGVSVAVHHTGKLSYQLNNGIKQASGWLKAIDVMEFACELSPALGRYRRTITEIDKLIAHSKNNVKYLDAPKGADNRQDKVLRTRQRLVQKAKVIDSKFKPQPVTDPGGGCFVATSILGDYDHPFVVELCTFRDEVLLRRSCGRVFVRIYYRISPPVADFIRTRPRLRSLSLKLLIRPAVQIVRKRNRTRSVAT